MLPLPVLEVVPSLIVLSDKKNLTKKIRRKHSWFNFHVRKTELWYILLPQISLCPEQVPVSESYSQFEVHLLPALLEEIVGFPLMAI